MARIATGELYLQNDKKDIKSIGNVDVSSRKDFISKVENLFTNSEYKKEDYKKAVYKQNKSIKYKILIAKIGG